MFTKIRILREKYFITSHCLGIAFISSAIEANRPSNVVAKFVRTLCSHALNIQDVYVSHQ